MNLFRRALCLGLVLAQGLNAFAQTATLEAYSQNADSIRSVGYAGVVRSPAGTNPSTDGRTTTHPLGTTIQVTCPSATDLNTALVFQGWAPTAFDPVTGFAAADTRNPLSITLDANRRLVGYLGHPIATVLNTPGLTWISGGHALWTGSYDVFGPGGGGVARGTTLRAAGEETYLETTVTAPTLASFNWRLDAATGTTSTLQVSLDGVVADTYTKSGANTAGWKNRVLDIPGSGPVKVRFRVARSVTSTLFANPLNQENAYLADFGVGPRSAPSGLSATPGAVTTNGFVTIRWTTPGFGASSHRVELATDAAFTSISHTAEVAIPATSQAFFSLNTATRYYYRVTALASGQTPLPSPAPYASFIPDGRAAQTITFTAPTDRLATAAPFTVAPTASSGLDVVVSVVSGPAAINGNTVTLTGEVGTVVLRATQAGNTSYSEATAEVSFLVTAGPPTTAQKITFAQPAAVTYGVAPLALSATASSGLPVAFTLGTTTPAGIASLDGSTLTITGAGKIPLTATQPGAGIYKPAASVTRTLEVKKAPLTVRAADTSRLLGAANPGFTLIYTETDFVNGETAADLAPTRPVARTTATAKSAQGDYPITVTGGADANYAYTPAPTPGRLTVLGFGGSYEALLVDKALTPLGKLSLLVPTNAFSYSGTLVLSGEIKPISFKSAPTAPLVPAVNAASASTTLLLTVGGTAYDLDLTVSADGTLAGSLDRDAEPFADLLDGARVLTFAKGQSIPGAGANTLALHPAYNLFTEGALPGGSGHATATIAASTGMLTLKGNTADGLPLSASIRPTQTGYHLWTNPYGTRTASFLAGRLSLEPHPEQTRFPGRSYIPSDNGLLIWQKAALPETTAPAKQDRSYRGGFGPLGVPVSLDPWLPPSARDTATVPAGTLAQRLGLATDTPPGVFTISHNEEALDLGAREEALPFSATLASTGTLTIEGAAATAWKIKLTPTTGAFTGSFVLRDPAPTPTRPSATLDRLVTFSGTLRQAPAGQTTIGTGFFLVPGTLKTDAQPSGEIRFTAP